MSLKDQLVLVCGGSGTVGSGVVRSLLSKGATVVVPSRSEAPLVTLKEKYIKQEDVERLFTFQLDIGTPEDALKIKESILKICEEKKVEFKHVVSSIGSWANGDQFKFNKLESVSKIDLKTFDKTLHMLVGAHFVAFRTFFPLIQNVDGSSYTFVTGGAAEKVWDVNSSIMSVGASALRGLVVAAKAEAKDSKIRVNEYYLWLMVVPFDKVEKKFQNSHFDIGTDLVNRFVLSSERETTHKIDNKNMLTL
jgi:NAD(P)-dependent dehydrogenase (short-subunit alcohol dehydrogenase family)